MSYGCRWIRQSWVIMTVMRNWPGHLGLPAVKLEGVAGMHPGCRCCCWSPAMGMVQSISNFAYTMISDGAHPSLQVNPVILDFSYWSFHTFIVFNSISAKHIIHDLRTLVNIFIMYPHTLGYISASYMCLGIFISHQFSREEDLNIDMSVCPTACVHLEWFLTSAWINFP